MTSFAEISNFVIQYHESAVTKEDLERYFQDLSLDICNKWKIHHDSLTEFLWTWKAKSEDLAAEPFNQDDDLDNCWALALEIGQSALLQLNGNVSDRTFLVAEVLMEEVHSRFRSEIYGVDSLEDLESFMVGKYVSEMAVHHRPREIDQEAQESFEKLIEELLRRGPVVVAYDVFPSYNEEFSEDLSGQGIFCPTAAELKMHPYLRFARHCVVLFGKGVEVRGSRIQGFWEALESRGRDFGDNGFVRLARGQGLIREVVELKV